MGESFDDITILKASGSASRLTIEEQKKKVVEAWNTVVKAGIEEHGDKENFMNALNNNHNLKLSSSSDIKKEEDIAKEEGQKVNKMRR